VVASGEHMLASLHFASSKEMLRCAENTCCKRMFKVFWMFQRYAAMF
jgi:glycerol-3-phosphate dehydrogenase